MTFNNIILEILHWNMAIKASELDGFKSYFYRMVRRKRVFFIFDENGLDAILFFFLTDRDDFHKKSEWDTPKDNENGPIMLIDKMVAREVTIQLRRTLQSLIENQFPNVKEAYYLRAPKDRRVTIKRREIEACTT